MAKDADAFGKASPCAAKPSPDASVVVPSGSLRTWSYDTHTPGQQLQVVLSTEGCPLDAHFELWHGPDSSPCKVCGSTLKVKL